MKKEHQEHMEAKRAEWEAHWAARKAVEDADAEMIEADIEESDRLLSAPRQVWIHDGGLRVRSLDLVACAFSVTRTTVAGWIARGCPGKPGCYDLPDIYYWAKRNIRTRIGTWE